MKLLTFRKSMSKRKYNNQKLDLNDHELVIDLRDWLDEIGIKYKPNGTGQLIFRQCFNCGAKEKLYLDSRKGVYNCFKCGGKDSLGKGNIIKLAMNLPPKLTYEQALKKFYNLGTKEVISARMEDLLNDDGKGMIKKKREEEIYHFEPLKLNRDFEPLNKEKHPEAWNYLLSRGLDDFSIERLGAFYWERDFEIEIEKDGEDVKVPIRDKRVANVIRSNGQIMGYIGRDITGQIPKAYKVLNSPGKFRSHFIWNLDQVSKQKESMVLCEGIFSAVKCGILRSVALLGKTATPKQIDLIIENNPKKIYICLDVGTEPEQDALYDNLILHFPKSIYRIVMPEVMSFKEKVSLDTLNKINSIFKTKFSYYKGNEKELLIPQSQRTKMKLIFKSKELEFTPEEFQLVESIADKQEYKDAGDYSFDEMNKMIEDAQLYKKKSLISL